MNFHQFCNPSSTYLSTNFIINLLYCSTCTFLVRWEGLPLILLATISKLEFSKVDTWTKNFRHLFSKVDTQTKMCRHLFSKVDTDNNVQTFIFKSRHRDKKLQTFISKGRHRQKIVDISQCKKVYTSKMMIDK